MEIRYLLDKLKLIESYELDDSGKVIRKQDYSNSVDRSTFIQTPQKVTVSDARWNSEIRDLFYNEGEFGTTRGAATTIPPEVFLKLAAESNGEAERRANQYGKFDASKFSNDSLPKLYIDTSGKINDAGHEGRARAMMLKQAGIKEMPVILILDKNHRTDDVRKFPTTITAEQSSFNYNIGTPVLLLYGTKNPY